jgi:hypothetical protein
MDAEATRDAATASRPGLGKLMLGAATLAGERTHLLSDRQTPALALVVGLVSEGRDAAARAAERVVDGARQAMPGERFRQLIDGASERGKNALATSREQAAQWLASAADSPIRWAEQSLIPRVVDDMRPYVANTLAPQVIDDVMPQIRTTVVPAIIEDLAANPKVRAMVTEQSHGAVAAATGDLREAAADADDRVETAFRNAFRRGARM